MSKLWYGSVNNRIMERVKSEPKIGGGATITAYTDRYAGTVVSIDKGIVTIREDIATRTDKNGMSDCQSYKYKRNPLGTVYFAKKNREGRYVIVEFNRMTKRYKQSSGNGVFFGDRDAHHDYNF